MARKEKNYVFSGCDKSKGVLQAFLVFLIIISFHVDQSAAQGITIEGTVMLESAQKTAVSTTTGGYQNVPSGSSFSDKDPSSDNIVLWLEAKSKNTAGGKDQDDKPVLDQVDKNFKPRLMIIRAGDVVRIRNSDPVYHNVFSLSKTKRFDVGRRSPEDYQDVQFDDPGKVDVFCDIHSDMHAVIIVAPRQTVAMEKMENGGQFQFKDISRGQYTLHLYALGDRSKQINIEVTNQEKVTLQAIRLGS